MVLVAQRKLIFFFLRRREESASQRCEFLGHGRVDIRRDVQIEESELETCRMQGLRGRASRLSIIALIGDKVRLNVDDGQT